MTMPGTLPPSQDHCPTLNDCPFPKVTITFLDTLPPSQGLCHLSKVTITFLGTSSLSHRCCHLPSHAVTKPQGANSHPADWAVPQGPHGVPGQRPCPRAL